MIKFRLSTHSITDDPMVEIWRDGAFVASIYGHEEGVRIVSKYLDGVEHEVNMPPSIVIKFSEEERGKE